MKNKNIIEFLRNFSFAGTTASFLCLFFAVFLSAVSCKSTPSSSGGATDGKAVGYGELGEMIAKAKDMREEIAINELDTVDEPLIVKADEGLIRADDLYSAGESKLSAAGRKSAQKDVEFALSAYTDVLSAHWYNSAVEARQRAIEAREDALKLKADIAVKEDFEKSVNIYNQGERAYGEKENKLALSFYIESASMFVNAASLTREKRQMAALALHSAEAKILESEKIAADAETMLDGR